MTDVINLPYELWENILTYTNDYQTATHLFLALPKDAQQRLLPFYKKHCLSICITILYANIQTLSIYKNNHLYKNMIQTERVIRIVRFRPNSNEFCVALINGYITFYSIDTGEPVRTIQLPSYYIDLLDFHPDGNKMVTISGPQIKLWSIGSTVSILNSINFVYPAKQIALHPTLPFVFICRLFNNKLIELYRWNYHISTLESLPLQIEDDYLYSEFLIDDIYIQPIMYPIHFSSDAKYIEGLCNGHIKTIPLENNTISTVINRTHQPYIYDFLWNKNRTVLYYTYSDSITRHSIIRIFNGNTLYKTSFNITKLLGLIENDTKLLFIENTHVVLFDLKTLELTYLFEFFSNSLDTRLVSSLN